MAAVSIATPALAEPTSASQDGYVTRSQGRDVYNFVPVAPSVYGSGRLVQEARRRLRSAEDWIALPQIPSHFLEHNAEQYCAIAWRGAADRGEYRQVAGAVAQS